MKTRVLTTLTILAAALSLQAQSWHYGLQGAVNLPLTSLKDYVDSKPGPGLGVHGTYDLGDGHMLRPRLDYTAYPEAAFGSIKRKASTLGLGGDYLFFISGKPEGLYLTLGVAGSRWSFSTTGGATTLPSSTTKIGLTGGVGCQWSATLGTELRFVHSRIQSDFKGDALQLGVTIRF